jgi:DNA-binding response OmpR family regulator
VKPGVYEDAEAVKLAEARHWDEHGYRFGAWQFLPETGEVRRNGCLLYHLTPSYAHELTRLVAAYPAYIPGDVDGNLKIAVYRLRKIIGHDAIESVHSWGYRFNPAAVL